MVSDGVRGTVIVGGGPVGVEAALYAQRLGDDVLLLEADAVGASVRDWKHVRMFSPWSLDVTPLGLERLEALGRPSPPPDGCPTGGEFLDDYLLPLARSEPLASSIREGVAVRSIGREAVLKGEAIGEPARDEAPFRLLVEKDGTEGIVRARRVIDATGVYGQPNRLGSGGIAAPGERGAADAISYRLEDYLGRDRRRYAGRTTLLVGAGHSAATAACDLARLAREKPGTEIVWAVRSRRRPPVRAVPDDPLPERARLVDEANALAEGSREAESRFSLMSGRVVEAVRRRSGGLEVDLARTGEAGVAGGPAAGDGKMTLEVDRIVGLVGYRPDLEICRELQVHTCYATEGPMELAAALLGADGADCLAQTSPGAEALRLPEPSFLWLGHKSYGRNPAFLLRRGHEQIRDAFRMWRNDPELDLYGPGLSGA